MQTAHMGNLKVCATLRDALWRALLHVSALNSLFPLSTSHFPLPTFPLSLLCSLFPLLCALSASVVNFSHFSCSQIPPLTNILLSHSPTLNFPRSHILRHLLIKHLHRYPQFIQFIHQLFRAVFRDCYLFYVFQVQGAFDFAFQVHQAVFVYQPGEVFIVCLH